MADLAAGGLCYCEPCQEYRTHFRNLRKRHEEEKSELVRVYRLKYQHLLQRNKEEQAELVRQYSLRCRIFCHGINLLTAPVWTATVGGGLTLNPSWERRFQTNFFFRGINQILEQPSGSASVSSSSGSASSGNRSGSPVVIHVSTRRPDGCETPAPLDYSASLGVVSDLQSSR